MTSVRPITWDAGTLNILDQRLLPLQEVYLTVTSWEQVAEAIETMAIRGAPLIGVAAAYGLALAQQNGDDISVARNHLAATRPTAVNLNHALDRVVNSTDFLAEAIQIEREEVTANLAIAKNGAALVPDDATIITICNTGSLASPGVGTALGVIRAAHEQGKLKEAILCETRPRQQGLRLTAWELSRDGIPFRVIPDAAAAWFMKTQELHCAIAGADRIAANGDTANKIGTYALALACKAHDVPFFIAAPTTTIDPGMKTGDEIPIEERDSEEIIGDAGQPDTPVWNPAFDVTEAGLISSIITETTVELPPYRF